MDLSGFIKFDLDLFLLKLPTYKSILVDILQNDDLDKFIQLSKELNTYLKVLRINRINDLYLVLSDFLDYSKYTDTQDEEELFEINNAKNYKKYDKAKKILIKKLKTKWKWLILQNLKSESCKIIRFLIMIQIHGLYKHMITKLKNKFTNKQRLLISEAIVYYNKKSVLNSLVIEPSISKKTSLSLDEIKTKCIKFKVDIKKINNTYNTNHYSNNKDEYIFFKTIDYKILNSVNEFLMLPRPLMKYYLQFVSELSFVGY